ncbi:hypothetical protein R1sor_025617 [Riccia sorocarpa]|uniref:Reverse transcriptase zinc-binding domain-containing protein n=1 Tax=Riccia sorocarpa TaxID=122646 RepID=A0ABD3GD13_9MARC
MAILKQQQQEGRLAGVKIPGGRQALYNLFADDTGLSIRATEDNYLRVTELLQHYEAASGAKLNVRKSVMIPVSMAEIPLWMTATGCRIAREGELVLHLGFPGGINIQECQGDKQSGGMQILSLADHANAVKIRQVASILEGDQTAWTHLARAFLLRSLSTGRRRAEMRRWTAEEALLLGPRLVMKESPTLQHLLKPWYKIREHLVFAEHDAELPASLTTHQVLLIATQKSSLRLLNEIQLRQALKATRVNSLSDLHPASLQWQHLQTESLTQSQHGGLGTDIRSLLQWVGRIRITNIPIQQCKGWLWTSGRGSLQRAGWQHETKWWKQLLKKESSSVQKMNNKWSTNLTETEWKSIWKVTWLKPSTSREGIWWWRTMWKGFWSGEQAAKINVSDGICPRCTTTIESIDQMFWSCSRSKDRWNALRDLAAGSSHEFDTSSGWFQFKRLALSLKSQDTALCAVAAELYRVMWRERNDLVFRGIRERRPIRVVITETILSVSAWFSTLMLNRNKSLTVKTLEALCAWSERLRARRRPWRDEPEPGQTGVDVTSSSVGEVSTARTQLVISLPDVLS